MKESKINLKRYDDTPFSIRHMKKIQIIKAYSQINKVIKKSK